MKILSIDQSSKATGVALFEDGELKKFALLTETSTLPLKRINSIIDRVEKIYDEYKPDRIVMEEVLPEDPVTKLNDKTYHTLMYLQGGLCLMFDRKGKDCEIMIASHWRKLVGLKTGRGVKREELKAASVALVKEKYGIDVNDDVADAILIGNAYINKDNVLESNSDFEII